jgi:hypothetical protein
MDDDALSDYLVHSGHDTTARSFKTSEQNPSINLVRSDGNMGSNAGNVNGEDQARFYAHEACRTGGLSRWLRHWAGRTQWRLAPIPRRVLGQSPPETTPWRSD